MHARIIGFLMIHLYDIQSSLGSAPITQLAKEVVSRSTQDPIGASNQAVYELGIWYRERLLRPCMWLGIYPVTLI